MPLFQNTVVVKHLKSQHKEDISLKWEAYKTHFLNPEIQENIRNSKEEQYQGEFLIDLFVKVLGYTKNPNPDFNLTTEYKNVKDSKKADGAIIINEVVTAVIELKGTNTTDLSKVETQAFGYKNNQPECTYVITSNFEKLRFYIDNAIEHIEFNLFTLTEKEFNLLYLCLAYENIEKDIPKKIKEESVSEEDAITKKLYKDYSLFRRELHLSLVKLNPQYDALTLFKKTQKLLDRFLFLFFAEDRHLLPPNSVRLILEQWEKLKELDAYTPLFDRFKKYFGYLNTGFKGKQYNVYAYNGGLFKPDEILDNITIDDDLLYKHTLTLSEYDFDSEVDVNILGHIFENSLSEIEEIQSKLEGQEVGKTTSKRKKDGVFYTPKYITKYIVENTIGKLCEEKKEALQINEEDYITDKKRQKKTRKALLDKLTDYRNWLLQLTICDPACGSGAFLNQALDFLITEHSYIDELQAKLFGDTMILSDVENSILENNLFGVDINQESVEIAKLSLWLRTAQPNRKLNDLSNNIKCGNSLIDDPEVAGEKAFKWGREFPQIFKEKDKKIYHVTTAIHDSRTSKRMTKYKVRERRDMGTNPYPNVIYFTKEDDLLITQTIAQVVKENDIKLLAYNICADHIHLLLVCDIDEIPSIMQKIKGRSSFASSSARGLNPLLSPLRETNKPLWQQKYSSPKEVASQEQLHNTIDYIQNNRHKHELPAHNHQLKLIIETMCCDLDTALNPEYTGGFDVVIGNPPYVRQELINPIDKQFLSSNYNVGNGTADLYVYFYEKSISILNNGGFLGFITPNKFYKTQYGAELRNYLVQFNILKLIDFFELKVFEDASTDSQIIIVRNNNSQNDLYYSPIVNLKFFTDFDYQNIAIDKRKLSRKIWTFLSEKDSNILNKVSINSAKLSEYSETEIFLGVKTAANNAFIIDKQTKEKIIFEDPKASLLIKPYVSATDIKGYHLENKEAYYLINTGYNIDVQKYPSIVKWLHQYEEQLIKRQDKGIHHYNLRACNYYDKFEKPKIMFIYTAVNHYFNYDEKGFYVNNSCFIISNADKFLSACLNSSFFKYYKKLNFVAYGNAHTSGRVKLDRNKMKNVPIPNATIKEKKKISISVDSLIKIHSKDYDIKHSFVTYLKQKYRVNTTKKLQNWHELEFGDFIKELNKAIKKENGDKLTKMDEMEWMEVFETKKAEVLILKEEIDKTNAAIDQMVYELYGLTEEEIAIVEGS
ncbi:MAG: BREX-1 system adenine-specific DNA-methyltransferase PglX [Flavobacteriaceae bacterium]|nr:BREX-1 system adenine-specific DNA-methyltransferase PglX [Flavobacteriaceae bacterium]